ncbi:MAG: hypothetical protein IKJ29_00650 [Akkermansia sp.]|nr:hypothetical protein [Akkermansia sp.]
MHENVKQAVGIGVKAATGIGVAGVFVPDWPALSIIWVSMLHAIADHYGKSLDKTQIGKLVAAVIAGAGVWMVGSGLVSKIMGWLGFFTFGTTTAAAAVVNSIINGFFTWRLGVIFEKLMSTENGGASVAELTELIVRNMAPSPKMGEMKEFFAMYRLYHS